MAGPGQEGPYVPDAIRAERGPVLRRTLRGLPDASLAALVRGLDRAGDRLAPGRLFRSGGGGCPVGVMLHELEPDAYPARGTRFWLLHAWRRRVRRYPGLARAHPRLQHLEWIFDRAAVASSERGLSRRDAALAVGRWFRAEAAAELDWRGLALGASTPEGVAA
jgi:hypothetical protein